MKNRYVSPMIQVLVLNNESVIMSGSQDVPVKTVTIHDECGDGGQLSKRHASLFDDEEDEDNNW